MTLRAHIGFGQLTLSTMKLSPLCGANLSIRGVDFERDSGGTLFSFHRIKISFDTNRISNSQSVNCSRQQRKMAEKQTQMDFLSLNIDA